jgi:anti-sigma regulatory factor (Ser/Thr protein kinase)
VAELRFTFDSENRDKEHFFVQLRQFAVENQWLPAIANEVELILEEWLTNVRDYGLSQQPNQEIRLKLESRGDLVEVEIIDNGLPFDPTQRPDPDVTLPAEERPIGGLGIFMMKKLSKKLRYERNGQWNRVVIEKDLTKPVLTKK